MFNVRSVGAIIVNVQVYLDICVLLCCVELLFSSEYLIAKKSCLFNWYEMNGRDFYLLTYFYQTRT